MGFLQRTPCGLLRPAVKTGRSEVSGIDMEFQNIPSSDRSTQLSLMLASGDLPDMIWKGVDPSVVSQGRDQDLFMPGKLALNLSAGALETLHRQADSIFRGAITDTLLDAMG